MTHMYTSEDSQQFDVTNRLTRWYVQCNHLLYKAQNITLFGDTETLNI
jgi:hypothetical protein